MRSAFTILAVLSVTAQGRERDSANPFDDVVLQNDTKTWPTCATYGGVPSIDVDHMCCAMKCGESCGVRDEVKCLEGW